MNMWLVRLPLEAEVKAIIDSIKLEKTTFLDGFTSDFFKHYWDLIKCDVMNFIEGVSMAMIQLNM